MNKVVFSSGAVTVCHDMLHARPDDIALWSHTVMLLTCLAEGNDEAGLSIIDHGIPELLHQCSYRLETDMDQVNVTFLPALQSHL